MVRMIDYQAIELVSEDQKIKPVEVTHSPRKLVLATINVTIPRENEKRNHIDLKARVGIRGISGISQILFTILRDGEEIYRFERSVESDSPSENSSILKLYTVDKNVEEGAHTYRVVVENHTKGQAVIVGPISFSGAVMDPIDWASDRGSDEDHCKDRSRHRSKSREQDREKDRSKSRDLDLKKEDKERERHHSKGRKKHRDKDIHQDRNSEIMIELLKVVENRERDRNLDHFIRFLDLL